MIPSPTATESSERNPSLAFPRLLGCQYSVVAVPLVCPGEKSSSTPVLLLPLEQLMKRHLPRFLQLGMVVWLGCFGHLAAAQGTRIVAEGSEPHHPRQPQVAVDEAGTVNIA